jgi:CRISPR-associated protein Csm1
MSLQIFLQAQIHGSERFLTSPSLFGEGFAELAGRCGWLSLISEALPRALLSELKLSRMLLGSSGGEQFLLVLTDECLAAANEFLTRSATAISDISGGALELVWASTENLGAWQIARKRLEDALSRKTAAPLADFSTSSIFVPFEQSERSTKSDYFAKFGARLISAQQIGWSATDPAHLSTEDGDYTWPLQNQSSPDEDVIAYPRRYAMADDDVTAEHQIESQRIATPAELADLAEGASHWGILRGDVDNFNLRLRRADSIEEHIQLSFVFKEFFAGELSLLCTLPEFWRKVTILYRGGDDFAVIGAWDALVALARELERVFEKFVQQNLQSFPGLEGKSITMALELAGAPDASAVAVFEAAGQQMQSAKTAEISTFYLFGRTLEWKRLADAEELKNGLVRLVKEFGYSATYVNDLASVYREAYSAQATRRNKAIRVDKPWRTHMRLSRIIPLSRKRELNQLRSTLIANLIGKKTANAKLRPSGRVGLEWARLAAESK